MEKNLELEDINIEFGKTTPKELLALGYELEGFSQIIEEPTLAECSLFKNSRQIAILYFYEIKELIEIDKLHDIPIDMAFLDNTVVKVIKFTVMQKLKYNFIIHIISALVIFLTALLQNKVGFSIGEYINVLLTVLPTTFCTVIWANDVVHTQGNIIKKLIVCLSAFINLIITIVYYYLIYSNFLLF